MYYKKSDHWLTTCTINRINQTKYWWRFCYLPSSNLYIKCQDDLHWNLLSKQCLTAVCPALPYLGVGMLLFERAKEKSVPRQSYLWQPNLVLLRIKLYLDMGRTVVRALALHVIGLNTSWTDLATTMFIDKNIFAHNSIAFWLRCVV